MEVFLGTIFFFGFNFAPRGWSTCEGQLLSISQNSALFSLLGTYYGGNGQTTFALPDLRGRYPMGQGQGPGLTPRTIGEASGRESVQLTLNEMPSHTHTARAASSSSSKSPAGNVPGFTGFRAEGDRRRSSPLLRHRAERQIADPGW